MTRTYILQIKEDMIFLVFYLHHCVTVNELWSKKMEINIFVKHYKTNAASDPTLHVCGIHSSPSQVSRAGSWLLESKGCWIDEKDGQNPTTWLRQGGLSSFQMHKSLQFTWGILPVSGVICVSELVWEVSHPPPTWAVPAPSCSWELLRLEVKFS